MDEHCPKCGNEIYKPYKYCNACGWDKSQDKQTKGQKDDLDEEELDELEEFEELDEFEDEDKTRSPSIKSSKKAKIKDKVHKKSKLGKKGTKIEKIQSEPDISEGFKPLKITCKCGGVIKIKTAKRPLKFRCPDCGRKGELKGSGPKKPKGPVTPKASRTDKRTDMDMSIPTKSKHKVQPEKDYDRDYEKGHMKRPEPKKRKRPKFEPPKDAYVVKPVKGKCTWCGSRNLRYFDDGSGRCANCGKEFNFGGDSSRILKKEYLCQHCRKPLEFIEQYQRWYCYNCGEYA